MRLKSPRDFDVLPITPEEIAQIDFNDHSTVAPAVWAVNVTFMVLVGIVVALRIYTRACITKQFFIDDRETPSFFRFAPTRRRFCPGPVGDAND